MGFEIRVPKRLQEELKHIAPHLKIILPAAAAAVWLIRRVIRRGKREVALLTEFEAENEDAAIGPIVEVELPTGRGALLPIPPPKALKTTLLEATFSVPLDVLWKHLMSGSSDELVNFHRSLGEQQVAITPWRQRPDGRRVRILRFTTPLKNPLGPRHAINREELAVEQVAPRGWVVSACCNSQGVPFAGSFANHVQWVARSEGASATRLCITGECRFIGPIWGPLKGTVERESLKGMSKAYASLRKTLEDRFGVIVAEPIPIVLSQPEDSNGFLSLLQSPHANPAVIVLLLAMFVIMWRMALLNTLALQVFQKMTVTRHS